MWVAIAAVGCALAVVGLFLISGDAQDGDTGNDGSNVPGIILCLLVVLAGYALMQLLRDAPAASAGVTAVILGLPALALFLTIDIDDVPPFSIEAFLGLPALVWGLSYLIGPGKGRPVLLGFALAFAWLFVLQVVEDPFASGQFAETFEPNIVEDPFAEDFGSEDDFGGGEFDEDFGGGFDEDVSQLDVGSNEPSATTIGWLSVAFGAAYLTLARLFDRRRLVGTATPFVVAGHIALITGIVTLSDDLGAAGVGLVLVIVGVLVSRIGAVGGRRLTTIIGAVEIGLGALIVLGDSMDEASPTSFGTALFVLGAAIAALAQVLHVSTGEPPQTAPGPSSFPRWSQAGKQVRTVPAGTAAGPWTGPPAGGAPGPWGGPPTATGPWAGQPTATDRGPDSPQAARRSRISGMRPRRPRLRPSRPPRSAPAPAPEPPAPAAHLAPARRPRHRPARRRHPPEAPTPAPEPPAPETPGEGPTPPN